MRAPICLIVSLLIATSARGQDHSMHGQHAMPMPEPEEAGQPHAMTMPGMFGPYPMSREASGSSWQPEASGMTEGVHRMDGPWMTMVHGDLTAAYDHQGGPRGDKQTFAGSMLMAMAQRDLGEGTLGLRAMLSLDPAMGKAGYPLLFQTGETANGQTPLVDRQHPHDLFMELAASYSRRLDDSSSVFLYAGLPGEPALGPTAFMHRPSGQDNPEAPLSHHWLDSTHVTFGVVTAGAVQGNWKAEISAFNGREPDQFRWNIETRRLDSVSARLTYNPTPQWSMQISQGRLDSPETLEPEVALRRTTASATTHQELGGRSTDTTLAWGRNHKSTGVSTNAYLLESALEIKAGSKVFGRLERLENDELFDESSPLHGQVFPIRKLSLGIVHELYRTDHLALSAGAVTSKHWGAAPVAAVYGGSPSSYTLFLRAKIVSR